MDIYGSLERKGSRDLPEEYTTLAANELRSYILQDDLKSNGEDETLEVLMKTAERFLLDFQDVVDHNEKDPVWIHQWVSEQSTVLSQHAQYYQPLYKGISHLTESHFVSPWAMCFIIEACVANMVPQEVTREGFFDHYAEVGEDGRAHYHYVVRFMENLIGRFFETYVMAKAK